VFRPDVERWGRNRVSHLLDPTGCGVAKRTINLKNYFSYLFVFNMGAALVRIIQYDELLAMIIVTAF